MYCIFLVKWNLPCSVHLSLLYRPNVYWTLSLYLKIKSPAHLVEEY